MKLVSCHIENFGKFHDYSREFCDGANIICEENGWGKSTFAAFVRAMFYGFEGERKRSLEENERKRYKPWQGGVFGGQLVFEIEGKRYQISRIFKEKEANDEFELRDVETNLLSKDFSNKIGEEIFKINRESFVRTIFIGQSECETTSTDDINAKIGNLSDNSNDLNNFEAANARLTEIINQLNPNRVSGSIARRREEIAKYERIVQGGGSISDSMEQYQKNLHIEEERLEAFKIQMQKAGEEQTLVSRQQSAMAKKSEWERLKRGVLGKKKEEEACRQAFPGAVPPSEGVKNIIAECGKMEKSYERVLLYQLSEEETAELSALKSVFADGVPSNEEFEEKRKEAATFRRISQELSLEQMSPAELERLNELEPCFVEESENVAVIAGKWNQRNSKKDTLSSREATLGVLKSAMEAQKPQKAKKLSPLCIIGSILVIIGIIGLLAAMAAQATLQSGGAQSALLSAVANLAGGLHPATGVIVAVVGVAVFIAGIVGGKQSGQAARPQVSPELEALQRTIDEDMAFIDETDAEVADYLALHGKSFEERTVTAVLQEITEAAVEYSALKKKAEKAETSTKAAQMEILRRSLASFLEQYKTMSAAHQEQGVLVPTGSESSRDEGEFADDQVFSDELYVLKSKVEKYVALNAKQENFEKEVEEFKTIGAAVVAFLNQYGYKPSESLSSQIGEIRELTVQYQNARKALRESEEELGRFEAENDMEALAAMQIDESLPTLEELNQLIQRLANEMEKTHNSINDYNNTLEDLQRQYDEWEECRMKLEELKRQQAAEQKKYNHVLKARVKLGLAKEVMTAKYADPILKGFSKYYEMISGNVADGFHVDANTKITVDEFGKQRDTVVLSSGYRDLVGICLRIALVDAMYKGEAPFLVMDDPFTNLDDEKVLAGRAFLEKLAQTYQIIYFTCSKARCNP